MRRPAFLAAALLMAGCASMDQNRRHCATMLGRDLPAPSAPGGPVDAPPGAKPVAADPEVEACAVARADQQEREVAIGFLAVLAAGVAGASYGAASSYRPSYRPAYRPSYRRLRRPR